MFMLLMDRSVSTVRFLSSHSIADVDVCGSTLGLPLSSLFSCRGRLLICWKNFGKVPLPFRVVIIMVVENEPLGAPRKIMKLVH
jgi:hypothetical protein